MATPLMPKATAVWLVDNTALTFDQIADFCGLHNLEVQAIADGEVAPGMQGLDPTANGQLNKEEIVRCEADTAGRMDMAKPTVPMPKVRQKGARYTPISKRQDRPDAIAWLLRSYPELSDAQISRLIGTTKPTINAIRDKTHRNSATIKPQSPVYLGLCAAPDLEKMIAIARARAGTTHTPAQPLPPIAASEPAHEMAPMPENEPMKVVRSPLGLALLNVADILYGADAATKLAEIISDKPENLEDIGEPDSEERKIWDKFFEHVNHLRSAGTLNVIPPGKTEAVKLSPRRVVSMGFIDECRNFTTAISEELDIELPIAAQEGDSAAAQAIQALQARKQVNFHLTGVAGAASFRTMNIHDFKTTPPPPEETTSTTVQPVETGTVEEGTEVPEGTVEPPAGEGDEEGGDTAGSGRPTG